MGVRRRAILFGLVLLTCVALVGCTAGSSRIQTNRCTTTSASPIPIACGWIEGKAWRITVDPGAGRLCAGETGMPRVCADLRGLERGTGPAILSGAEVPVRLNQPWGNNGVPIWNGLFGTVRPDVTLIVMRMTDGREVRLRPVTAAGARWVGVVL